MSDHAEKITQGLRGVLAKGTKFLWDTFLKGMGETESGRGAAGGDNGWDEKGQEEDGERHKSIWSPGLVGFLMWSPGLPAYLPLAARYSNTDNQTLFN